MNKLEIYAAIVMGAVLATAGAHAADSKGTVTVDGNVSNLCMLGSPDPASIDLGQLAVTSGDQAGHLQAITDKAISLPGSFCNYAGTALKVEASALLASDVMSVQSGYSRAVNFTATVSDWASPDAAATTAASEDGSNATTTDEGGTQTSPKLADLTLTLSNFSAPGNDFLVAGSYAGSVTITLGPK